MKCKVFVLILFLIANVVYGEETVKTPPKETEKNIEATKKTAKLPKKIVSIKNGSVKVKKEKESLKWTYDNTLTTLTILAGFCLLLLQIYLQNRSSLLLQKDNIKEGLKVELFKQVSEKIQSAEDVSLEVASYIRMLPNNFIFLKQLSTTEASPQPVRERAQKFAMLQRASTDGLSSLLYAIEKCQIAFNEYEIFQLALNHAAHEINSAYLSLFQFLMKVLPIDMKMENGSTTVINVRELTEKECEQLEKLVNDFLDADGIFGSYLYDINIEVQNSLLGDLFNTKLQKRKPLDGSIVMSTESEESISYFKNYINSKTKFGIDRQKTEETIKAGPGNEAS